MCYTKKSLIDQFYSKQQTLKHIRYLPHSQISTHIRYGMITEMGNGQVTNGLRTGYGQYVGNYVHIHRTNIGACTSWVG